MGCSRVAVRVGRRVAAFEMDLVRALVELGEESVIETQAAVRLRVDQRDPALDALGIELHVPARVKRVGQVDALAVAAYLDHLRTAVERTALGMGCFADDSTEVHAPGLL